MVRRNMKGQILIEAIFLLGIVCSVFFIFQGLIERHRIEINKTRLSHEIHRSFKDEKFKNQSAK